MAAKRSVSVNNNIDFYARLMKEGIISASVNSAPFDYPYDGTAIPEIDGVDASGVDNQIVASNYIVLPTRISLVTEMTASCSAEIRLSINEPGLLKTIIGPNAPYRTFPNSIAHYGSQTFMGLSGLIRPVKNAAGTVTNKVVGHTSIIYYKVSADINFGAKNTILFIGDSNMEGGAILPIEEIYISPTLSKRDFVQFKIAEWYNSNGQDCRVIDKSEGGASTTTFLNYAYRGWLDLPEEPNLVFINLGTNNISPTTFTTEMTALLAYLMGKWKSSKFILLGSIPAQGPAVSGGGSRESVLATIRTNTATIVSNINQSRVTYINCGTVWSISDNSKYSTSEADGGHIHAGVAGHQAWADFVINEINTNHPTFKTL